MPDDFNSPDYTGPMSWEERFYSLNIPINLVYKFERWVFLYGGLSNTINLNKPENMFDKKINHYTLGISGGINFLIKNRLIVGVNYYRNIIPTAKLLQLPSKTDTYKISYSFEQINLKIGYIIKKTE
jgi:hypothetical protein